MDFLRQTLQTITSCCLNCHEDTTQAWANGVSASAAEETRNDDEFRFQTEPTERTGLLIDQQRRNVVNSPQIRRISEDDMPEYANSLPKRDEQTALNSIVQQTNS